ncbi:MAG: VOC family protein [candidate division Zixibacteria bacterium]|nr:VOC family protein [candidate division Zixibacteria bacterium]
MSEDMPQFGIVTWIDLTVKDAESIRDFYSAVVGWDHSPVSMGSYNDYSMLPENSEFPIAGVCHARGVNANLPAQWLIYITVEDLDESIAACKKLGGKVLVGPKTMSDTARYCVIKDPAGAVTALYEELTESETD